MGLVDTVSIPTLLTMVASGRIPAEKMGTHSFTFGQMDEAYDVFKNAAAELGAQGDPAAMTWCRAIPVRTRAAVRSRCSRAPGP